MKNLSICVLFLSTLMQLNAEPVEKKDPIYIALEKAIEKDSSTAGMVEATAQAEKKWDQELNVVYKKLKEAMSQDEWKALEASQKSWVTFRDKEFTTQSQIYSRMEGSMWKPVAVNEAMELVKMRVLTLRGYLDTISQR